MNSKTPPSVPSPSSFSATPQTWRVQLPPSRKDAVELRFSRLTEQLASRMPKGRDLTSETWLETLAIAISHVPHDENEAKFWQDSLLRQSSSVPFPVAFETNEDQRR